MTAPPEFEAFRTKLSEAGKRPILLLLRKIACRVPHHHMGNLMRHHSCQLRLCLSRLYCAEIDEDRPAGQCERIDILARHHVKGIRPFVPRRVTHQPRPKLSHVLRYWRIIRQYRHLLIHLRR